MNYILLGPEEGNKNEWIQKEKKRVLNEHPDAEITTFFAGDDNGNALSAVLGQSSLFSSFRLGIVKMFENRSAKDGLAEAIIAFLESGQSDAELIIATSEKSEARIPKGILDRIPKEQRIFFWEMFENKKREWIEKAFRADGFMITPDGVDEILFSSENNTQDMKNLVSSLTLYFRASGSTKKTITSDDIAEYGIKTRTEDGNTLFFAIAEGDLEHAIMIMKTISESDSFGLQRAFTVIGTKFRLLESFLREKADGADDRSAAAAATYISPYPENFAQRGIKTRELPYFLKAARKYSISDAGRIIRYLGRIDAYMKSAGSDTDYLVFTEVLYTIIVKKGEETRISLLPPDLFIRI